MNRCHTEIVSKMIDSYRNDNYEENLYLISDEYMRGYLGGLLCAYRIVFGKNYEERKDIE